MFSYLYFKIYVLPFVISFLISFISIKYIIKYAKNRQILDYPSRETRKIHKKPVPLLGGIAVIFSFITTSLIGFAFNWFSYGENIDLQIVGVLLGALILMIFGFLDDKYNIKSYWQFAGSALAVFTVIVMGVKIGYVTNPFVTGSGPYGSGILYFPLYVSYFITFFWIILTMYTIKLTDGLDGLVAGIGFIGSIILFMISLSWNQNLSAVSVLSLIAGGSLLAVLFYNWNPAKVFLGESSIFIGFILGVLSIISGAKIATTLLIIGMPLIDMGVVVLWRLFIEKKNPFTTSDRKHIHFRLMSLGLTHKQVVLFLYFVSTLFGISSVFLRSTEKIIALLSLVFLAIIVIIISIVSYVKTEQK